MHNREITHIVKTNSLSKTQLIVRTKCSFCCHLRVKKTLNIIPLDTYTVGKMFTKGERKLRRV